MYVSTERQQFCLTGLRCRLAGDLFVVVSNCAMGNGQWERSPYLGERVLRQTGIEDGIGYLITLMIKNTVSDVSARSVA